MSEQVIDRPPEQQNPQNNGNVFAVGANGVATNVQNGSEMPNGNGVHFAVNGKGDAMPISGNGSHGHEELQPSLPEAQTDPELTELNRKAEESIFGAILYNEEGKLSKARFGKVDEIKNDTTFGATKKERLQAAEEYKEDYENLTASTKDGGEGLEPSQAKIVLDARERDWPLINKRAEANKQAGMSQKEAEAEAANYYNRNDEARIRDIRENKIYTPEAYSEMLANKIKSGSIESIKRDIANRERRDAIQVARTTEGNVVTISSDGTYRHVFKDFERIESLGTHSKRPALNTEAKGLELYTGDEDAFATANALPVLRGPRPSGAIALDAKQDTVNALGAGSEPAVDDKNALPAAAIALPAAPAAPGNPNNPDDWLSKLPPVGPVKKSREIKPDILLETRQRDLNEATEAYARAVALQRNADRGFTGDPAVRGRLGRLKNWIKDQTGANARREERDKNADDIVKVAEADYKRRYVDLLLLMEQTGVDKWLGEVYKNTPDWRALSQVGDYTTLEAKIFDYQIKDAENMSALSKWIGRKYATGRTARQYATLAPTSLATGVSGSLVASATAGLVSVAALAAPIVMVGGVATTAIGAAEGRAIARRANKAYMLTDEARIANSEHIEKKKHEVLANIGKAAVNQLLDPTEFTGDVARTTQNVVTFNKERVARASRRAGSIAAAGFAGTQLATRVTHAARGRGHGNTSGSQSAQNSGPTRTHMENVSNNQNGTIHSTVHRGDGVQRLMQRDLGIKPEKAQAATEYLDKHGFFTGENLKGAKKIKGAVRLFSGGSDGKGGFTWTAESLKALRDGGFIS